jgi:hypothetical protein
MDTSPETTTAPAAAKQQLVRDSHKRVREVEIIAPDRLRLMEEANRFIGHMIEKQVMPLLGIGSVTHQLDLSSEETKAYNSALDFMRRQFELGDRATEVVDKRIETESTMELKDASST